MKRILLLFLIPVIILKSGCTDKINREFNTQNLRCEYMKEAVVEKTSPRFSWELVSTQNDQFQTAWQLIVSDKVEDIEDNKGSVWDSKKRNGSESFGIKWKGDKLQSFTQYYWKVRVWDRDGNASGWSETASFITGAYKETDWKASWIGEQPEPPLDYPLLYKHIGYLSSYSEKENEEKWVQIDLNNLVDFNEIKLYPSLNNIRGIKDYYYPLSYRIELSRDGSTWGVCYENEVVRSPGGEPVSIELDSLEARYVRLVVEKMKSYKHRIHDYEDRGDPSKLYAFSLAEMQILSDKKILSSHCKVSYKDALIKIDREDGYDPDMLTDGITTTPPYPAARPIPPSPMLRKSIELKDKPVKALVCVSALGLYDLSINSQSPDSRVLAPEWTDYHKRVQYQVIDVKNLLDAGTNVIGVQLADGWYAGMLGPVRWSPYYPKRGAYGLDRRFFFQMELEYADGEKETIVSDESWKIYTDGPIRMADNFLGESYDANREIKGWKEKDFDDSAWAKVFVDSNAEVNLVAQTNQPIKIVETLESKSISETKNGFWLFDIGENIAGWSAVKLEGNPGDRIILRHGEIIDDEGELYTENLGAAIQTDTVILGPSGKLEYESRFTYHGFRYVEVQGLSGKPDKNILHAKVIASDQPPNR